MSGTKITQRLSIDGAGKDIVLDGFDFTAGGFVNVSNASRLVIRNCRIYGLDVEGAVKNFWLFVNQDAPLELVVENCFFGANPGTKGKLYNMIEPHVPLADGSRVCENYFAVGCCTHNTINLYGAVEDAHIKVDDNVFEVSAGTVRVGVKGSPVCDIEISRNTVLANDPAYTEVDYGIVTVQPFNKSTTTFANMTIRMDGNVCPSEQSIYGYYSKNDTVLTAETMPTIVVNGAEIEAPIYH